MISGILRDPRRTSSHNSLSMKDVTRGLLSSLVPSTEVAGAEGLVSGITQFVKDVLKKIVEGFKYLWNLLFGKTNTANNLSDLGKQIKALKDGKFKSGRVPLTSAIAYFVPKEHHTDERVIYKDLADTSEMLFKALVDASERTKSFLGNTSGDLSKVVSNQAQGVINETLVISPNLTVKFHCDVKKPEVKPSDCTVVEKTTFTAEEIKLLDTYLYLSKDWFNNVIKNLEKIVTKVPDIQKNFEHVTKEWETLLGKLDELNNTGEITEGIYLLKAKFGFVKTSLTLVTKDINSLVTGLESWMEKK